MPPSLAIVSLLPWWLVASDQMAHAASSLVSSSRPPSSGCTRRDRTRARDRALVVRVMVSEVGERAGGVGLHVHGGRREHRHERRIAPASVIASWLKRLSLAISLSPPRRAW